MPSSVSSSVASIVLESLRSSTREKPRNTSGRNAVERREITTTFSRPVSRLMRRVLSFGRGGDAGMAVILDPGNRLADHTRAPPEPIDLNHDFVSLGRLTTP